ncbi:hypothetical protein EG14_04310 [Porphyromonas gingivalis]|nr:hypothetical protein EG14_01995 [Porphyromonas gingivalis]AIJ35080.1 hypothetical protein EG14_03065 [Porphyromonas gingivalis]AIJ35301.1 hypothetical protein EG14_04310 [Porphyromonas gingivalis]
MVEGRVFCNGTGVGDLSDRGKKKRPYIAFGFGSRLFFYPKNFTARRKAIFVRRMNKTNITCGYSDAINRDVREGVLSLGSKMERYRKIRSLSLPRGLGSFIFRAFPASNFASFFEARQKGQKEKNKER